MKFKVTQKIFDKFPDAKFGVLIIEGISNKQINPEVQDALSTEVDQVKQKYSAANIPLLPQIKEWRSVFDKLNLSKEFLPSHESLLKRALSEKGIPSINSLVDIYNIFSLKHLIPVGGHAIDEIDEIRIDETTGEETFQTMNTEKIEDVNAGELGYISGSKILTRNFVWRQSETSKITEDTKSVFVPLDDVSGRFDKRELEKIARELGSFITTVLGGTAKFTIIDSFNSELNSDELENIELERLEFRKYPKVIIDEEIIDEILTRGISNVLPDKESFKKLLMSGKRIKIFEGFDPSADKLHIGNAIGMRMLEKFRKLGHHVVFLMGTGTGKIGDPTDKAATRQVLTDEIIENNIKGWKDQASQILDFDNEENPVEIVRNGDWLKPMSLDDFLGIGNMVTLQQLLERDMFQNRIKEGKPISVSEVLYPLLQGYDSVAMQVDAEFGGNDQMFNMMMGRTLSKAILNKEKWVITGKLIQDSSGIKMGKSLGNVINLTDSAEDIFGKIMSFTDGMMLSAFEIITDIPMEKIEEYQKKIEGGENPIEFKKILAFEVTKWIKGEEAAQKALDYFAKTVQNKETPDDIKETKLDDLKSVIKNNEVKIIDLILFCLSKELGEEKGPIKRIITQGGLEINGEKIIDINHSVKFDKLPILIKVGKRNWIKIA